MSKSTILLILGVVLFFIFKDKIFPKKDLQKIKDLKKSKGEDAPESGSGGGGGSEAPPLTEAQKAQFKALKKPTTATATKPKSRLQVKA